MSVIIPATSGAAILVPPTAVQPFMGRIRPDIRAGVEERFADAGVGRKVGNLTTCRARRVRRQRLPGRPFVMVGEPAAAGVEARRCARVADRTFAVVPYRLESGEQQGGAADPGDERIVGRMVDLKRFVRR